MDSDSSIHRFMRFRFTDSRFMKTDSEQDCKLLNRAGTEEKQVIVAKPKPTVVVIDNEIKRWDKKLVIETERVQIVVYY